MAKIFVVDDNPLVGAVARSVLAGAGHHVTVFDSPFGTTAAAKRTAVDLILLDVCMPALRGDVLAELLQKSVPGVPILFYSALEPDELSKLVKRHGAVGFVGKSVKPYELVMRVNSVLESRSVSQVSAAR